MIGKYKFKDLISGSFILVTILITLLTIREEKPDIAVFIEVSKVWAKELAALKDLLPYSVVSQDSDNFGTALFSKLPLENVSLEEFQGPRKTIVATIKYQGKEITIMGSHLNYPVKKVGFIHRNSQLEAMADYLVTVNNPVILMGDFNITMWSPFYKGFIEETKLKNGRFGFGVQPTWPNFMPLLAIPIDHCFVSRNIQVIKSRIGRDVDSDHLPIITDLAIGRSEEVGLVRGGS